MKHLFLAILCTVIGSSTYANNPAPKKDLPAVIAVEVKAISNKQENEQKTSLAENKTNGLPPRKQTSFLWYDGCGNRVTVWVSAPAGTSNFSMTQTAFNYVSSHLGGDGCFN